MSCFGSSFLKLIYYYYCLYITLPLRTPHSGQVVELRNLMKNELKTTRVWKRF